MYYETDHSSHMLAKAAGFLVLPALGALATRVAAPAVEGAVPKTNPTLVVAGVGTLAFGALAYALYRASESSGLSEEMQAVFRGGMWGAGLSAAFAATLPVIDPPRPVVSGPGRLPAANKAFDLLTAQAAGAVAAKRSKKLAPAR